MSCRPFFDKIITEALQHITTLFAVLFFATACIEEENFDNSPKGNFDALWSIIDERYCFFEYAEQEYGLSWDNVYTKYRRQATETKNAIKNKGVKVYIADKAANEPDPETHNLDEDDLTLIENFYKEYEKLK